MNPQKGSSSSRTSDVSSRGRSSSKTSDVSSKGSSSSKTSDGSSKGSSSSKTSDGSSKGSSSSKTSDGSSKGSSSSKTPDVPSETSHKDDSSSKKDKNKHTPIQDSSKKHRRKPSCSRDSSVSSVEVITIDSDSDAEFDTLIGDDEVDITKVKVELNEALAEGDKKESRKILKQTMQYTKDNKIKCPLGCSSTFSSPNNMFIHVENRICKEKTQDRCTLVCRFGNCNHTNVTPGAMKAHEYKHLGLKEYVCPVVGCGRDYAHNSSLMNHKYAKHSKLFPPPESWYLMHCPAQSASATGNLPVSDDDDETNPKKKTDEKTKKKNDDSTKTKKKQDDDTKGKKKKEKKGKHKKDKKRKKHKKSKEGEQDETSKQKKTGHTFDSSESSYTE